jgi:hypothetical protein
MPSYLTRNVIIIKVDTRYAYYTCVVVCFIHVIHFKGVRKFWHFQYSSELKMSWIKFQGSLKHMCHVFYNIFTKFVYFKKIASTSVTALIKIRTIGCVVQTLAITVSSSGYSIHLQRTISYPHIYLDKIQALYLNETYLCLMPPQGVHLPVLLD